MNNAPSGTNVQLIQGANATVEAFNNALADPNAAAVIFVGHAAGREDSNGVFQATGIVLSDGTLSLQDNSIQVQAQNVCINACDSEQLRGSFNLGGQDQSFIGIDSGSNGYTSTHALTRAGFNEARAIINGSGPDRAVDTANSSITLRRQRTTRGFVNIKRDRLDVGDRVRRVP